MSRFVTAVAVVLALVVVSESGCAQQRDLKPGMRVRITAPTIFASRYEAVIGTRRGDTLSLVRGDARPIDVPLTAVTRIDVGGTKDRWAGARRGALWGTGIGVALFALAAIGPGQLEDGPQCTGAGCVTSGAEYGVLMAMGGAMWGAGIGALIGREKWQQVTPILQANGLHGAPTPGAVRLGLRVNF